MTSSNNTPKTAMILAAGFGKRLRPLTDKIPKSLIEVNGKPIIDRVIDNIKNVGITNLIVNAHYLGAKLAEHLSTRRDVDIKIIHEDPILETGGGILNAFEKVEDQELLVVNSDNIHGENNNALEAVMEAWDPEKMNFLVALKDKNFAITYNGKGDYGLDRNGKLIHEDPQYIFSGVYIVNRDFFKERSVSKFRVPDVIANDMGGQHRNFGIPFKGDWFDIGNQSYLEIVNNYLKSKEC